MESCSRSRRSSTELLNQNNPITRKLSGHAPLEWIVGTWRGKGKGIYPTIKDFEYSEECSFYWDPLNPRPLLFYKQKTFSTVGHPPRPMHVEAGFLRVINQHTEGPCIAELVVSAPNGVATIEEGFVEGHTIKLKTTSVVRSSTSRSPYTTGLERTYTVYPNSIPPTLHYTIDMATSSCPTMTRHLEAVLTKWDEGDDDEDEEGASRDKSTGRCKQATSKVSEPSQGTKTNSTEELKGASCDKITLGGKQAMSTVSELTQSFKENLIKDPKAVPVGIDTTGII
eukprot:gene2344-8646_t